MIGRGAARAAVIVVVALVASVAGVIGSATPAAADASITSASGPLTKVRTTDTLNCDVNHISDGTEGEFFGDTACGTFVVLTSAAGATTRFTPDSVPAGSSAEGTPFTFVSQTGPTGTGTLANPYTIVTVVDLGTSGVRLTQTDTYVVGEEAFRTDVALSNTGGAAYTGIVYRAADCYLQGSDTGFGRVDGSAISCQAAINSTTPADRIEQWYPLTPGSSYYQAGYSDVWQRIGANQPFDNTCECNLYQDNGAGLSWNLTLPAGRSTTFSSFITFSPLGNQPVLTRKTANPTTIQPGGTITYTISYENPNDTPVTLTSLYDDLPAGFAYVPGSTTGITTADPWQSGQNRITWTGSYPLAAGQTRTLTFRAVAPQALGSYDNTAGGTASDNISVAPAVATARVAVVPRISINPVSVTEGNAGTTNAVFPVTLSQTAQSTVTASFVAAVDATATNPAATPADFTAVTGTVTIAAGSNFGQITVPVKGETIIEQDEQFKVTLSNPQNATLGTASARGTIVDDDRPDVSINDVRVTEGHNGLTNAVFTVSLSRTIASSASVAYRTTDSSALAPGDYTSVSGTVTIPANTQTATVSVPVVGDTAIESDETFNVFLSNPVNSRIADTTGVGTIVNDDTDQSVQLTIGNGSIVEGNTGTNPARQMPFTITLSAPAPSAVTVTYSTAPASPVSAGAADYTARTNATVVIPSGTSSATVYVPIVGDLLDELDETFLVNVVSAPGTTITDGQAVGTITDDDATPTIAIANRSVVEGASGVSTPATFTVTLSARSGLDVSMQYATADGTAVAPGDYVAVAPATLTIPAGAASGTVTVTVRGDNVDEPNEGYLVNLTNAVNATFADAQGAGGITDDDVPEVRIADRRVIEGTGSTVNAVFSVALSSAATGDVSVRYVAASDSAVAGADFTAVSGTLVIPAASLSGTITVPVAGDALDENDETFRVTLSSHTGPARIADGLGIGTITDDDASPTVSVVDTRLLEGDSGTKTMLFTVRLSTASGRTVTVPWSTANGSAVAPGDFTAATGTVTFAAGQVSRTAAVTIVGDLFHEPNEYLRLILTTASVVNATVADGLANGTILDEEGPFFAYVNDVTKVEGTGQAIVTISLSAAPLAGETATIGYKTTDGSAVAPGDYTARALTNLVFDNATGASRTVAVVVNQDTLVENDEVLTVDISARTANARVGDAQGTITIIDDEP